ncbi:hypothetical protein OO17_27535 [Rhodopseudomonas palustris]|uniref:Uncharacterized protein n=1 Tax=Rhodopseudomonas palustris TaxID=1076 RepID=A0A0D7E343_RHOPL|nr:hypothetical protein OO17_27535 [Rhodopseudomonas palustris]
MNLHPATPFRCLRAATLAKIATQAVEELRKFFVSGGNFGGGAAIPRESSAPVAAEPTFRSSTEGIAKPDRPAQDAVGHQAAINAAAEKERPA